MRQARNQKKFVHYDHASDVLYLGAREGEEEEFVEIAPGIGVELDQKGQIIGIEILHASRLLQSMKTPVGEAIV